MIKEIKLPEISETIHTGKVVKILVSVGDVIEEDHPLIELETEKAMFEVPSTEKGTITEILIKEGDNVEVGQTIMKVETGIDSAQPAPQISPPLLQPIAENMSTVSSVKEEKPEKEPLKKEEIRTDLVNASPGVRKLARELGVELKEVPETDNDGRITEKEVKNYVKNVLESGTLKSQIFQLPDFSRWGEVRREPMSKVRSITAKSMINSLSIPQVTQYDKADITKLEEIRKKKILENKSSINITITSILLSVLASALKQFPKFNASIDMAKEEIIYKNYCNIGVAVDTDRGLLVPVVKNVDKKDVLELSAELSELAAKARNKKITPDEMEGGNFTISNLGGIGGTSFSPIVYPPQVAILGVSRSTIDAVRVEDKFEPRSLLPVSLSYDHRIIDGADGARFLRWVCNTLENPFLI